MLRLKAFNNRQVILRRGRGRICFIWHDVKERKTLPACSSELKGKRKPFTGELCLGWNNRGRDIRQNGNMWWSTTGTPAMEYKLLTAVISFLFIAVGCRQWTPAGRISLTRRRPLPPPGLSTGRISVHPHLQHPNLPCYGHFFPIVSCSLSLHDLSFLDILDIRCPDSSFSPLLLSMFI